MTQLTNIKTSLSVNDIQEYVDLSEKIDKLVVVTDSCGSGKTVNMIKWIIKNLHYHIVIVVERKEQAKMLADWLVHNGIRKSIISIYDSDHKEKIYPLYSRGYSKQSINIITHQRIWMTAPYIWEQSFTKNKTILFIDEILSNVSISVKINAEFLTLINRYTSLLDIDINDFNIKDTCKYIYMSCIYAAKELDIDIIEDQNILLNNTKKIQQRIGNNNIESISYINSLIAYAILSNREKEFKNFLCTKEVVLSPIYLWSSQFDSKIIFDATGEYFPYPKECHRELPKVKPKSLINVKIVNIKSDKRWHKRQYKNKKSSYSLELKYKLSLLLNQIHKSYDEIYACTWKDLDNKLNVETILNEVVKKHRLENKISVAHYGMTRGSNLYKNSEAVILLGHYYYPQKVYDDLTSLSMIENGWDPITIVIGNMLQEIYRASARSGKVIDCYLCMDTTDSDYDIIIDVLKFLMDNENHIRSIQDFNFEVKNRKVILYGIDYLRSLLPKTQKKTFDILVNHTDLATTGSVKILKSNLKKLLSCRPDKIEGKLKTLTNKTNKIFNFIKVIDDNEPYFEMYLAFQNK